MTVQNPQRIQRKRTKGWTVQAEADRLGCSVSDIVYVGRGSKWGNPFPVSEYGIENAITAFRYRLTGMKLIGHLEEFLFQLRGKHLMCWCPIGQPCHADVLLELANKGDEDNGL